jgi:hypothetical protein
MAEDIGSKDMLDQYRAMLSGQQQDFRNAKLPIRICMDRKQWVCRQALLKQVLMLKVPVLLAVSMERKRSRLSAASSFGSALGNVFGHWYKIFGG